MNYIFKHKFLSVLFFIMALVTIQFVVTSCARMGNPDGGWYDETPPRVISASPADKATNVKSKKVRIYFNEFIKLENANEKVVISPPQLEQAEIKTHGKNILVTLQDSLKENTTYTIDFSDAILDNNEGNPMGNYTYSFSTGDAIDTLEVSGTVLNAEDLDPVKGILVGLYRVDGDSLWIDSLMKGTASIPVEQDTLFRKQPLLRVSRTDSEGRFVIRGIAPGHYRCFALNDMDGNYTYSQNAEQIAFNSDIYVPTCRPDIRQDTLWVDELHIKDINRVKYTHFFPDDITLRAFVIANQDRYFLKAERKEPEKITAYFSGPGTVVPTVKLLNMPEGLPNAEDPFIIEATEKFDTITYWLRDTALVNKDTLNVVYTYEATDSLGNLVLQTDTTEWLSKITHARRLRELKEKQEAFDKKLAKMRKKGEEPKDTIMAPPEFEPRYNVSQSMSPDGKIEISFPAPLAKFDSTAIHLYAMRDSVWYRAPFDIRPSTSPGATDRNVEIVAEWLPETEYSFEVDTLAFESIYGLTSTPYKAGLKVSSLNEFSSLFVNVSGVTLKPDSINPNPQIIVQLLDNGGKMVKESIVADGVAEFFYLKPASYYLRAIVDTNGNGKWDTGNYDQRIQPEFVYYNNEAIECKAKWDVTRNWDLTLKPLTKQKPGKLVKQKADKKKTIRQRNADRAREKGVPAPEAYN